MVWGPQLNLCQTPTERDSKIRLLFLNFSREFKSFRSWLWEQPAPVAADPSSAAAAATTASTPPADDAANSPEEQEVAAGSSSAAAAPPAITSWVLRVAGSAPVDVTPANQKNITISGTWIGNPADFLREVAPHLPEIGEYFLNRLIDPENTHNQFSDTSFNMFEEETQKFWHQPTQRMAAFSSAAATVGGMVSTVPGAATVGGMVSAMGGMASYVPGVNKATAAINSMIPATFKFEVQRDLNFY
jgi:hypothetical protein